VELLARVRRRYGVDLSLEVLFGGPFTIEELAKAIEPGLITGQAIVVDGGLSS
jgi:hypothetical protein